MPIEAKTPADPDAGTDSRPLGLTLLAGAVAAVVALPLTWLVVMAVGIDPNSAIETLLRPKTLQVVVNSVLMVVLVTGFSVLLGVPLAYLTARTDLPFSRFWTVAVSMPLVIPSYIGAFAFVSAFGPNGELQSLLAPVGIESIPSVYGLEGTVLVITLYTYPYVYLSTRASLQTMDERLLDAARMLNHSRRQAFRRVVLPQVAPAVTAGSLLVSLYALSDFGTPAIMRYDVFTRVIFVNRFELDFAALLSLQLVVATLFILAIESRVRGREVRSGGGGRRDDRFALGVWKWPATGACGSLVALALVVPIGILGLWLMRAEPSGNSGGFSLTFVFNSVGVSAAAALVAALASLPVAYLAVRYRGRLSAGIERLTYVGYAVPGVVIGLALVFFGARYATAIYQTLPLLVFAYVVRFLPIAVGSTRASLLQVDPQLQAAARVLGRSPVGAFREVTLPLVAPGVLAGGALVFLTTMKELPATLMLRPTAFETLVIRVWRAESAGYVGQAAIPALILVVVSALSMVVLLSQEGADTVSLADSTDTTNVSTAGAEDRETAPSQPDTEP
ncbi:MAG: iron(III) transport system permease protein [Haloarculaceae archaeon]|jgi:iron(III) transport system permease protein